MPDLEALALYFHCYIPGIIRSIFSCVLLPSNLAKILLKAYLYCCSLITGGTLKCELRSMDSVPVFGLIQKLTLNSGPQVFEDSDTLPEFTEGLSKQTFRQKWFLGQVLHIMLRMRVCLFSKHHPILSQDLAQQLSSRCHLGLWTH